jgi:flagellar hook assembly protein FlgD
LYQEGCFALEPRGGVGDAAEKALAAMTLSRALLVTLVCAALGAPSAAAGVRLVARDEPVRGPSTDRAHRAPIRFDMVGLHWRGSGKVWFRTRPADGAWSAWQPARPEAEDLPDRGTKEFRRGRGWKLGNPYWTGPADAIDYRLAGDVHRLRAYFLWSEPGAVAPPTVARAAKPAIITRAQWGADESIVRAHPYYADRVRFAVVHHTAGTNSYSALESAAIVRGIQRYHVLANGWNDIGYNFLVDKYGQVFEGRGGGVAQNVVGAHAQGFNTGSTGVSVLGTYSSVGISRAARRALVRLLAWRLDVAHVDPRSRLNWISGGNPEYPAGTAVRLRAVSGHRDTGPTSCPGSALYAQIPALARAIAAHGGPKLYDPEVSGQLGGPVRVTGRLSTALPWTVTIKDGDGTSVAVGSGSGTAVDWTWDASGYPFGTFTYTVEAGPDVRPWTAAVPGPPPLAVRDLTAKPRALAPDHDGVLGTMSVTFSLTTAATVTVSVLDGSRTTVKKLAANRSLPAGTTRLLWDGRNGSGALVADGPYAVRVSAASPGQSDSAERDIVVDRTLRYLKAAPRRFSPTGDGRRDTATATFSLAHAATVRVRVLSGDSRVVTLFSGSLVTGVHSFPWDGRDLDGARVADRRYAFSVDATTDLGTRTLHRAVLVDTSRPVLRIERAVSRDERTVVRFWLSERAALRVWYGSPRWSSGGRFADFERDAGYRRVILPASAAEVRLRAEDTAGNRRSVVTRTR